MCFVAFVVVVVLLYQDVDRNWVFEGGCMEVLASMWVSADGSRSPPVFFPNNCRLHCSHAVNPPSQPHPGPESSFSRTWCSGQACLKSHPPCGGINFLQGI